MLILSTTRFVEDRETISYGVIDQGLNRTLAIVLLDGVPREELLYEEKRSLLDKYDDIIASLQRAGKTRKLKQLRNKRYNVYVYHDWLLANRVAEYTDGYDIAIGNTRFKQTQERDNGVPTLRKRIGKWSYGRQRVFIAHKRAERGLSAWLLARGTRRTHAIVAGVSWSRGNTMKEPHGYSATPAGVSLTLTLMQRTIWW